MVARYIRLLVAALCLAALQPLTAQASEVPATPDQGGPRHFEVTGVETALNLRQGPLSGAPVVDRLAAGTLLTNLGCERGAERVWCYVQRLKGGPVGYAAADYLAPARDPFGGPPVMGPDTSALRAGQGEYDATGFVPCAQAKGQPMGQCSFGVARAGGGDATVRITLPGGRERIIFFVRGEAMGTSVAEADPASFRFQARKESDLHMISVGDERYEIPDAVVFGG